MVTATRLSPSKRQKDQNTSTVLTAHGYFLGVLKAQSSNPEHADSLARISLQILAGGHYVFTDGQIV